MELIPIPKKEHGDRNPAAVIGRIISVNYPQLRLAASCFRNRTCANVGQATAWFGLYSDENYRYYGWNCGSCLRTRQIVVEQHLVRGILSIILAFFAPGG